MHVMLITEFVLLVKQCHTQFIITGLLPLQIDFSKFEQPKVKMTYFYNASTDPDEHGSDQLVCQLKLAGQVHSGAPWLCE